jgi:hypothetical protein
VASTVDLKEMDALIKEIREKVQKLAGLSGGMQCVARNCDRIMAGVKMLELNVSDAAEFVD